MLEINAKYPNRRRTMLMSAWQIWQPLPILSSWRIHASQNRWWPHDTNSRRGSHCTTRHTSQLLAWSSSRKSLSGSVASVLRSQRLSRIDVNCAMWHDLSIRLLIYLLTCTTHSFRHYSYSSANYVDYVTSCYPCTWCSRAFESCISYPSEFGQVFSSPAFSIPVFQSPRSDHTFLWIRPVLE